MFSSKKQSVEAKTSSHRIKFMVTLDLDHHVLVTAPYLNNPVKVLSANWSPFGKK
jgi:hypothetical protein